MSKLRKKLLLTVAILVCLGTITGCYNVPITNVPEPSEPVVSNIARYEAPARTIAPEPQEGGGSGLG